jgi:hypothetical protein
MIEEALNLRSADFRNAAAENTMIHRQCPGNCERKSGFGRKMMD